MLPFLFSVFTNREFGFIRILLLGLFFSSGGLRASDQPFEGTPFGGAVAATFGEADPGDASRGNRLAMISGGYDALLLRVHLIRNARTSIAIQTFIWTNDECGRFLMYELIEAARRGVTVRIIADHMVSAQDPEMTAFLATVHPNLQIKHYRPAMSRLKSSFIHTLIAGMRSFHGLNQRMHNKVMIFDDAILVTGGRNVENTYFDHSTEMNFRDRDVLAVGAVVGDAVASFEEFWAYRHAVASRDLSDVESRITAGKYRRYETRADYDFGGYFGELDGEADNSALIGERFVAPLAAVEKVSFICDEPGKSSGFFSSTARITRALRDALEQAKSSIVMQTPYLVLSKPAQRLFRDVQDRNRSLRIRISSNSFASTDNLLAYSANYRLRNDYVQNLNLQIHEFKPQPAAMPVLFARYPFIARLADARIAAGRQTRAPFLCVHAKSLVVDDRIAFIGSYNLDPRSENLNTEAGLLVEDPVFAEKLREEIDRDMSPDNSWVIGRRAISLPLDALNSLVGGILSLGPVDLWPVRNTSSFELRPGATEVPPDHPSFHENYREAGAFPGTEGLLSQKEILTRIYKAVGAPLTPVL